MALRRRGSGLSNGPAAPVPGLPHNALLSFLPNDRHSQDKQERKEERAGKETGKEELDSRQDKKA